MRLIDYDALIRPDKETADVVWEDAYGYWDDDEGVAAVTHWMPLPEPPREQKKRIKNHVCNNDYCELE